MNPMLNYNPSQRSCAAVTHVEFAGEVNVINTCGLPAHDKPFPPYIPLCPAHRSLAEAGEIKVFTERVIARFSL